VISSEICTNLILIPSCQIQHRLYPNHKSIFVDFMKNGSSHKKLVHGINVIKICNIFSGTFLGVVNRLCIVNEPYFEYLTLGSFSLLIKSRTVSTFMRSGSLICLV
jgi:hypothetical protein